MVYYCLGVVAVLAFEKICDACNTERSSRLASRTIGEGLRQRAAGVTSNWNLNGGGIATPSPSQSTAPRVGFRRAKEAGLADAVAITAHH